MQILGEDGSPVGRVVARDAQGWPLAITDDDGWMWPEAPTRASEPGAEPLARWFEGADGIIHQATGSDGRTVTTRRSSRLHVGRTGTEADSLGDAMPTGFAEVLYWRSARPPWPAIHPAAATLLRRSTDRTFEVYLQRDEGIWFAAKDRGYAWCHASDLNAQSGSQVEGRPRCTALDPATSVSGRIANADGEPIPNAEILIDWHAAGSAGQTVVRNRARARPTHSVLLLRSDAEGRFASDRVAIASRSTPFPNTVFVRASRRGYVPISGLGFEIGPRASGQHSSGQLGIEMIRSTLVTGRVLDRGDMSPVAGAEVAFGRGLSATFLGPLPSHADGGPPSATTNADGRFELRVRPGSQRLLVRSSGHEPLLVRSLDVPETGAELGAFHLSPGSEVRRLVLDADNHPIEGALVRTVVTPPDGALGDDRRRRRSPLWFASSAHATSDRHGRFEVGGLSSDMVVDLLVSAPGFAPEIAERRRPFGAESPVEIRLHPEAQAEGRVRLADNRPAAARVRLELVDGSRLPVDATTNEKGEFRVRGLHAGRYNVSASPLAPGIGSAQTSVELRPGEIARLDVELKKGTKSLSGRVTTASGAGIGDVEISTSGRATTTTPDGAWRLSDLAGEHLHVRAYREGWEPLRRSTRVPGSHGTVDFEFVRVAVEGSAAWADGDPIANETLSFGPPWNVASAQTDSQGRFRVLLEPQVYVVAVQGSRRGRQKLTRLRVDGPTNEARIRFGRRLGIRGRAKGLTQSELARLTVEAVNAENGRRALGTVDSTGRFGFDWVDEGHWKVVGTVGAGERRTERQVRLTDEDVNLDLDFERLFALTGTVRLAGVPMHGARVLLLADGDPGLSTTRFASTLQDGSFRFVDVPRGRYRIGLGAGLRPVHIRGDERAVIKLVGGRLGGTVRESGARVLLWPGVLTRGEASALDVVRSAVADAQGAFVFDPVPEGAWTLHVPALSFTSQVLIAPKSEVLVDVR